MRIILIFLLFIFISGACSFGRGGAVSKVCFDGVCFNVEVARTDDELMRGLMYRESMAKAHGMLFVFKKARPCQFWMKNTLIGLDMIWIDAGKRVAGLTESARPCKQAPCLRYLSKGSVKYVLEINAGMARQAGISVGQQVEIK